jgi:antimicrobial peptide system SdpB family protein
MNKFINQCVAYLSRQKIWTNVYGVARSCIALGTFATFVLNDTSILFRPGVNLESLPICTYYNQFSLFCLLSEHLGLARWISVIVLFFVIIGWAPRITGILHWYIVFSFTSSATLLDGGDHIATIITFMLVPITITDNRKWHWDDSHEIGNGHFSKMIRSLVAFSGFMIIKFQVALIYLNAAGAKLLVEEWQNGTAVYYWFNHPVFGASEWLQPMLYPLITNAYFVTLLTWGSVMIEFLLFACVLASNKLRRVGLVGGIFFHFLIFIIHGLFSFFCTMTGSLILYLYPRNEVFSLIRNPNISENDALKI